ncbi:hypothetical protein CSC3H3_02795 [Thalassospira marina]|uniref:Uncharacterized protein n=1 Tax=Thalassospira marina TaxID=2048283 RepID=A0ABM6Q5H0_9PROT|nr:hypothetical protein CSC3H3_02795 [Thalassospira marina]
MRDCLCNVALHLSGIDGMVCGAVVCGAVVCGFGCTGRAMRLRVCEPNDAGTIGDCSGLL